MCVSAFVVACGCVMWCGMVCVGVCMCVCVYLCRLYVSYFSLKMPGSIILKFTEVAHMITGLIYRKCS